NKYKCTIPNTGKLNVKLSPGQTEVLTWTATYYIDGIAKTAKAYTVCYAPLLEPIASGVKLTWQDNESIAWISGATGLGAGNRTNKPANFIPIIGLIKTSGSVSDYLEGSSGGGHYGEKTGMTGYNWITNDSPKGSVVVDTSRYANLNQLPNLSVGFVVAKNGGSADKSEWHVKNYNGVDEYTGNKKGDSNNATQKSVKGAGSGAPTLATGTGKTTGIKYNNPVWSQNVSETNEMRFRAMSYAYDGSMYRSVGAHTCYMSIIKVDKSALRNLVNSHVDMAEQAASYSHQSARFAAYQKAIKDAAELLGNPASAVTENDIVDKFNTLSKQTYSININHRFNNGRPMQSIQKSFEIGSTVIFGLCDHTGYTPKAAIGYTTSFDTQTVTNCQEDITQYYDYDAHTYTVFYNGNGNTGGITLHTSHTYDLEKKLAKNGFSKNGYTFIEWNTEADGSGVGYEEGQPVKNLTDENGAELTLFAIWKVNKHYIVFNGNSGVGTMDKQEVEFGSSVILYENKYERENYAFVAWNTKQDGTGVSYEDKGLFGPMPDQDVTLYAQWRYAVHNIVFHANGGSGNMENQPLKEGVTEQLNENTFERTGYAFERWNTQEDGLGDSYDDKGEITMGTSNIDLYAQWTAETYTVTFDGNGGTPDKESETVTYDQAYGELPEAEREGYIFAGWYTAKTGGTKVEETTIVTTAQDHTLYALWSINHYTISFESNGGTDVDDISGPYGSVVYEPEEPKKLGHTFDGWYEDEELETPVDWPYTMGASDVIFYAKWTANQYAITFDSNGGTEFEKIIEPYGTEVDEPEDEPEKEGHTFVAWYEDEELETPVSWPYTIGASNVVFYAKWEVKYYNISFDANGGHFTELVGSDIIKMSLPYGSDLVAPTVERAGYDFDGWDPELHNTVPAYDIDFVAKWVRAQTEVSFNLNGATAGTVPDTQKGDIGSAVDLPEQGNIEKLGYEFLGWALTDDA
ncbi:MAG TPA: InlB B-repeat-containing protein, partial [Clostridiales bacterium]|nr:InlB B-repeat-containing protein [Clostridiales bacterium]